MRRRYVKLRRGLYALGVLALLVAVALVALPYYVKHAAISAAEANGVHLTIDRVDLGWSEIRFTGIGATLADLPGVRVTLEEATATREGLSIAGVRGAGLDVSLEGTAASLLDAIGRKAEGSAPAAGAPRLPRIQIQSGRVLWTKPFGETSSIEATSLQVDLPPAPRFGDELHATFGHVAAAAAPGKELGPWTARLDRTPTETALHVELAPTSPGAATLTRSITSLPGGAAGGRWEIAVHGQKLSHVGVPGALLGIPAGVDPDVDLSFHHARTAVDHVDGGIALSLRGARFVSMSIPADVRLDAAWSGDPKGPIAIERGTFGVGPFAGGVTGTVQPIDGGFRTDLDLKSEPVACSVLAGAQAVDSAGALGALAQAAGLTHVVSGSTTLEGKLVLDTSAPERDRVEVAPKSNCSLSFLR